MTAAAWIDSQPAENTPELQRSLSTSWASRDFDTARAYAENLPAGPDRDQMLTGLLSSGRLVGEDAERLLDQIDDAEVRGQAEQIQAQLQRALEQVQTMGAGGFGGALRGNNCSTLGITNGLSQRVIRARDE